MKVLSRNSIFMKLSDFLSWLLSPASQCFVQYLTRHQSNALYDVVNGIQLVTIIFRAPMAPPFVCCGNRRDPSPDPEPVFLIDNSQVRGRFPVSISGTSDSSAGDNASVHHIFEHAMNGEAQHEQNQIINSAEIVTKHDALRKKSLKNIHAIPNRIRKSMSRDSGLSKRSPKRILRSSMSSGLSQRHGESVGIPLHRAISRLHASELGTKSDYDEDAIPMKTPKSTWGREQGAVAYESSQKLREALERYSSAACDLQSERNRRDIPPRRYAPSSATSTLSRMLTARGRQTEHGSNDEWVSIDAEAERGAFAVTGSKNRQKYVFIDESPQISPDDTPSLLGRSDTVIRRPSSSSIADLGRPALLNTVGTQSTPESPDLDSQKKPSIAASIAVGEWPLSGNPAEGPLNHLRFFDDAISNDDVPVRKPSSASDSIYHRNKHSAQHLASPMLSRSASQPLPKEAATSRDRLVNGVYNVADGKLRHRLSTSGLHGNAVPTAYGLQQQTAASSIYSQDTTNKCATISVYSYESPYITPAESHQDSLMFPSKPADHMNQPGSAAPAENINSVPSAERKRPDLRNSELRTRDTSFHSSNESLYNRELAAAETRIVSRAKTVSQPKSSWFKEDFDEVAAAIAATNPTRRSVSEQLGRKPSLSSYDGHKDLQLSVPPRADRFSSVTSMDDDAGTSVWERALREHEQEDAAISRTRLGSDAILSGDYDLLKHHQHREAFRSPHHHHHQHHILHHFSPDHKQGAQLQAKLDAYELPSSPKRRTPTDEFRPISTPTSYSSWTRYSSHDRSQRSSASAGEADNVFTRDFAEEAAAAIKMANLASDDIDPTTSLPVVARSPTEEEENDKVYRKSKSMTFGRSALAKLRKVYRVGSLEFASRTAFGSYGHRSSISEGKTVEYPELEMLPPLSPVVSTYYPPEDRNAASRTWDAPPRVASSTLTSAQSDVMRIPNLPDPIAAAGFNAGEGTAPVAEADNVLVSSGVETAGEPFDDAAKGWSRMYVEDCVTYPTNSPPPEPSVFYEAMTETQRSSIPSSNSVVRPGTEEEVISVDENGNAGRLGNLEPQHQLQHEVSSESGKGDHNHHPHASSSSSSPSDHLRKSTLDFQRSLESDERRARDEVLRQ